MYHGVGDDTASSWPEIIFFYKLIAIMCLLVQMKTLSMIGIIKYKETMALYHLLHVCDSC